MLKSFRKSFADHTKRVINKLNILVYGLVLRVTLSPSLHLFWLDAVIVEFLLL